MEMIPSQYFKVIMDSGETQQLIWSILFSYSSFIFGENVKAESLGL